MHFTGRIVRRFFPGRNPKAPGVRIPPPACGIGMLGNPLTIPSMARRMSNRDRLERLREEAHLAEKERGKQERNAGRMLAVWAVKDGMGEVVATFPYPRKEDAEREAARLKEANRRTYIVAPHKIPFDG